MIAVAGTGSAVFGIGVMCGICMFLQKRDEWAFAKFQEQETPIKDPRFEAA
jgi:hypothetical protein